MGAAFASSPLWMAPPGGMQAVLGSGSPQTRQEGFILIHLCLVLIGDGEEEKGPLPPLGEKARSSVW